jgi:hypothetical protein
MTGLERAEHLLCRLYPSVPEAALRQVLEPLAAAEARGTWDGIRPPTRRACPRVSQQARRFPGACQDRLDDRWA